MGVAGAVRSAPRRGGCVYVGPRALSELPAGVPQPPPPRVATGAKLGGAGAGLGGGAPLCFFCYLLVLVSAGARPLPPHLPPGRGRSCF